MRHASLITNKICVRPTCGNAGVDGGALVFGGPRAGLVAAPPEAPVKVIFIVSVPPVTEVFVEEALI